MPDMFEIEAQVKALAPVFTRLLAGVKEELTKDFQQQISIRDQQIEQLKKEVADKNSIEEIAQLAAKHIKPGEPGKDADMEELKQHLEQLVKAIPAPQDGKSVTAEEVMPDIKNHVDAYLKNIPAPQDGKPGKDAVAPTAEEIANTFERRFSELSLSWERQARELAVKAVEAMPKAKDGRDALPLDSFDLNLSEDGRTVTVKMQAGDTVLEKSVKIPSLIDKGVYSTKGAYEQGDGVSYAGCFWIAKCDDPKGVPGSGETDWRCAVKRGRDGKDLRDSAKTVDTSKGVSVRGGDAK